MCCQMYQGGVVALPVDLAPHHFMSLQPDAASMLDGLLQTQRSRGAVAAAVTLTSSSSSVSSSASTSTADEGFTTLAEKSHGPDDELSAASTSSAETRAPRHTASSRPHTVPEETQDDYAPVYINGTTLPIGGWFQSCRGCALKTAKELSVHGRQVPVCLQCQEKWICMARGDFPQGRHVPGVEPLSTWLPHAVPDPTSILSDEERRQKCEQLLLGMDDLWQQLINPDAAA